LSILGVITWESPSWAKADIKEAVGGGILIEKERCDAEK
jgi:hypothetical protein